MQISYWTEGFRVASLVILQGASRHPLSFSVTMSERWSLLRAR